MINFDLICEKHSVDPSKIAIAKENITVIKLLQLLCEHGNKTAEYIGVHQATLNKNIKRVLPDINLASVSRRTWYKWALFESGYKKCACCEVIKLTSEFHTDKSKPDLLRNYCSDCSKSKYKNYYENNRDKVIDKVKTYYSSHKEEKAEYSREYQQNNRDIINYHASKRRAAKLQAIAPWADLNKIKQIYENCPEGYQVDHIYPLQGIDSCGLHVETNLQYLTTKDNRSKGNKLPEEVPDIIGILPIL